MDAEEAHDHPLYEAIASGITDETEKQDHYRAYKQKAITSKLLFFLLEATVYTTYPTTTAPEGPSRKQNISTKPC